MSRGEIRRAFADTVRRRAEDLDLAEAALLIAAHEYPDLDIPHYLARLDAMAAELEGRLGANREPLFAIAETNRYLFHDLGFRGNSENYYDPRNSFLNEVLDRKLGIPISLSLVYMEVAQRVGLPIVGVGFPGHFLVKYVQGEREIFIDPFHQGAVRTARGLRAGIAQTYDDADRMAPQCLAAVTKRQILTRMLHNLKAVYLRRRAYDRALEIIDLLLIVSPWNLEEIRDRGMVQIKRAAYEDALADLEVYLEYAPDAADCPAVRRNVDALRRRTGVDPLR